MDPTKKRSNASRLARERLDKDKPYSGPRPRSGPQPFDDAAGRLWVPLVFVDGISQIGTIVVDLTKLHRLLKDASGDIRITDAIVAKCRDRIYEGALANWGMVNLLALLENPPPRSKREWARVLGSILGEKRGRKRKSDLDETIADWTEIRQKFQTACRDLKPLRKAFISLRGRTRSRHEAIRRFRREHGTSDSYRQFCEFDWFDDWLQSEPFWDLDELAARHLHEIYPEYTAATIRSTCRSRSSN